MKKLANLRNNPAIGCLLLVFTALGGLALIVVFLERSISKVFDEKWFGISLFDDEYGNSRTTPEIVINDNDDDYLGI